MSSMSLGALQRRHRDRIALRGRARFFAFMTSSVRLFFAQLVGLGQRDDDRESRAPRATG